MAEIVILGSKLVFWQNQIFSAKNILLSEHVETL